VKLPDPPLLIVTDRRQARRPLAEIAAMALAAGCRWISLREKDLPDDEQVLLARSLLPMARRHGAFLTVHGKPALANCACLMVHGEPALAKLSGVDGAHLPAGSDAVAARTLLGRDKIIGVSIHTLGEAETLDPAVLDYALAGPAFETTSKPGYGPEIGRKGLAEMAGVARVPLLAIGGINTLRIAEIITTGCSGVAVMGGVMRAAEPAQEVRALIATLTGSVASRGPRRS
jgi:thiamine-phosphate pyrophosphorylase